MSMTAMEGRDVRAASWRLPAALRGLPRILRIALAAHWPLIALSGLFILGEMVMTWPLEAPRAAPVAGLAAGLLGLFIVPLFVFIAFVFTPLKLISHARAGLEGSVLKQLARDIRKTFLNPARLLNFAFFVAIIVMFEKASLDFKANIPAVHPFSWDETFMRLDRWLHLGSDPWRLLHPLMGHAPVTFVVNLAYNLWFFFLAGSWFMIAASARHSHLKMRFMSAFMLTWLAAGGVMALAFSSAGPVYYARLGLSGDPFGPLMAYLHGVNARFPIWALQTQDMLWTQYVNAEAGFVGISAFPSMHNAVAALLALAAWRVSRPLGAAMTLFAVMILAGSVHLGWHYAVDGYAGILVAVVCWRLAGGFADWMERRGETRRYRALLRRISS